LGRKHRHWSVAEKRRIVAEANQPRSGTPDGHLTPEPREFAHQHHLDMETPLLLIARRLKCTNCNAPKALSRPGFPGGCSL